MARIPPNLEPAIREKAGQGQTGGQIAAWLFAEHGIKVTERSVYYRLEAVRKERAEAAKDIVQARLQKDLPADLDALGAVQRRLTKIAESLVVDDDVPRESLRDYLAVTDRLTRVLDLKLHYSGADAPSAPGESADPSQALVDRFAQLVERESVH